MPCRMRMRKQDPMVPSVEPRAVLVPWEVSVGPRSALIEIADRAIESDSSGDFLFDESDLDAYDAVHTFAVVQRVITLFERCLRRLGDRQEWRWHWGDKALKVRHRAGTRTGARYVSGAPGVLEFYSFDSLHAGGRVHTCQSFDAVAHEAGHAVLDTLRPRYLASSSTDAWALHEGFGDITVIFALLDQPDICEAVVVESKADLSRATFLGAIAEHFGHAFSGLEFGIRNALHEMTFDQAGTSIYRRGQVLTGAVYDWLSRRFDAALDVGAVDPAWTLHHVAAQVLERLVAAILELPENLMSMRQVANAWILAQDEALRPELIEVLRQRGLPFDDRFGQEADAEALGMSAPGPDRRRGLRDPQEGFRAESPGLDLSGTCGTFAGRVAADSEVP